MKIFANSLSGSVPVTVWSNESFIDMTVETYFLNETYYPDEEIYNEPYPGWNLVGFPSFAQNYTVDDLMVDILAVKVEGFEASAQPHFLKALVSSDLLRAGEGYWINVPSGTWWVIRN